MESNEQTELTSKIETDSQIESRQTVLGGKAGVERSIRKEKRLMVMGNSVVIARGKGFKGDKW